MNKTISTASLKGNTNKNIVDVSDDVINKSKALTNISNLNVNINELNSSTLAPSIVKEEEN